MSPLQRSKQFSYHEREEDNSLVSFSTCYISIRHKELSKYWQIANHDNAILRKSKKIERLSMRHTVCKIQNFLPLRFYVKIKWWQLKKIKLSSIKPNAVLIKPKRQTLFLQRISWIESTICTSPCIIKEFWDGDFFSWDDFFREINTFLIFFRQTNAQRGVEKSSKTRSPFLRKNRHFFRQTNFLLKKLLKTRVTFTEIFECDRVK